MKTINKFTIQSSMLIFLMLAVNLVSAAPPIQIHKSGSPVWCYGTNQFDQCVLYLGTEESCSNVGRCIQGSISSIGQPSSEELYYCMGEDDVTGECKLLLGDKKSCNNIKKCSSVNKYLPRAPRRALVK